MTSLLIISLIWKAWLFETNNALICIFSPRKCPFQLSKLSVFSSRKGSTRLRVLAILKKKSLIDSFQVKHNIICSFLQNLNSIKQFFFYLSLQNKRFTTTNIARMNLMAKTIFSPTQIIRRTSFLTKREITFSNYHFRSQYTIFTRSKYPRIS